MKSKTNQYGGLKGVIYRHYCCVGSLFYGWETLTENVFRSLACIQLKLHCIQLKCFFPECVSMWFFRLKACVAVFYIVCTCTVNSCRASLQYDGQAYLNYQWNKCNQCNYAWSDPSAFRPHLIAHNGVQKCKQCDFASHRVLSLRNHLKTHSGEKSNKCNQCNFASSDASNLRTHLKTHSGEKIKQMQPVWLCILWCTQFEKAFEHTVEKNQILLDFHNLK